ncbi:MAG: hypothetical protein E6Q97_21760 [Desulfurellales bacterium]|nr:MAG: hypothetical protein E6Q97_21760 [Desulfurellales bacterium]
MELCTKELIEASNATSNGLVLATRRDGRWDLVDPSEVSALRKCGEEPVKGYVEERDGYQQFVACD